MLQTQVIVELVKVKYTFNLFFSLSQDLFCIRGSDGYFKQLNPAWEKILGWTHSELHSRSWIELVHPDDLQISLSAESQCTREDIVEYENRYRHQDGSYRWLSWRVSRDIDGYLCAVARNITAEKDAEKVLRDRLEFERLITNLSTEFLNCSSEEIDCGINYALQAIGEFFGFDRSYVALFSEENSEANLVYEWYAESVGSVLNKRQRFSRETFSWWIAKLRNLEVIQLSNIHELPPETDSTKRFMPLVGTKSIVAVPMLQGKSALGYIGFTAVKEEKILPNEIVALLRMVGDIFVNALSCKQVQEKLRRSQEQLRLTLDATNMGFWEWDIQTGAVTWSNSLERLFGLAPNTYDGTFETFVAIVHPEDRDRIQQATQRSLETGEVSDIEFRVIWPDGTIHWMQSKGQVFYDETRKPIHATGINLDITERKLAEEQLRQSEEQLRLSLDAAQLGFWDWNIQTGAVTWSHNFKRIFGLAPDIEEGSYEIFLATVHPEDRDRVHQASIHSFETGESGDIDYRVVWPDGSIHWIESKFQFFFDEAGKPSRKTGIDIDVSDRKIAEIQLQESLQEKEILLQEIHHRVKNNLQVISSLLDLQSQDIEEQVTQEMFRESYNRVKSMALVHEKLYQSKDFAEINFSDYITSLTNELFQAYGVNSENIKLSLNIDETNLNIDTAIPCGLIVNELVSNALKHAFVNSINGKISITLNSEDGEHFILLVRDNGRGFPKDFDFQTSKSLGLMLVNVLTSQLEGKLELDCRNGTQFRISFSELRR